MSEEHELSRRERKKIETSERLLSAAWALFHSKGFEAATVEEITNAADVAKGTFFNYFASKEEMLGPLAAWRMSQLRDLVDPAKGAPASPLARIKLFLRELSQEMFPDNDSARRAMSMFLCRQPDQEHPPMILRRVLADLVREAQEQGEIRRDVDPRFVSALFFSCSFHDVRRRHASVEQPIPQPEIERIVEILLEGLAGAKYTLPQAAQLAAR